MPGKVRFILVRHTPAKMIQGRNDMYGSIIGSERTAKQMKAVALKDARLINGLDVYETGDGIIDSEMMRGKDFVIIESDGSGTTERFLTRFAEVAAGIGRINVNGTNFTAVYRKTAEDVFGGGAFSGKYTPEEFAAKLSAALEGKKDRTGIRRVKRFFTQIGIYGNLEGHGFLLSAVKRSVENPRMLKKMTTALYPAIAEEFATSDKAVERDIRNAITVAYNRGKMERTANAYYGGNFGKNEKPTNGEFIAFLTTVYNYEDD